MSAGLTIGSLFSGIGGLELGLEWAGVGHTVWQVEQDAYCRAVLAKHWPDATRYEDVRCVGAANLKRVDVMCGGFPCQDISVAGRRAGLAGERSGLFYEFARVIRELRPRYAVLENVTALLADGLGEVLRELAASGYDAEWDCVPASSVGAPHQRDRIFILAYPTGDRREIGGAWDHGRDANSPSRIGVRVESGGGGAGERSALAVSATASARLEGRDEPEAARSAQRIPSGRGGDVAHPASDGRGQGDANTGRGEAGTRTGPQRRSGNGGETVGDADGAPAHTHPAPSGSRQAASEPGWWSVEPDVGRVAHGVPARVDRLRALGNAVVPQVAEVVGKRLLAIHAERLSGAA